MERCYCIGNSCEEVVQKVGEEYVVSNDTRFNFIKEDNCIVDGGVVDMDIPTCRATKQEGEYFRKVGEFREYLEKSKNDYSDKGGHRERSLANDNRRKGHKEHWKKQSKRTNL